MNIDKWGWPLGVQVGVWGVLSICGLLGMLSSEAQAQTTTLESVALEPVLDDRIGASSPVLSADGRYVAFQSSSSNLVPEDTNRASDIFVRDRQTGVTTRVSVLSDGGQADGGSASPAISADGRFVAFQSDALNLMLPDGSGNNIPFTRRPLNVFVHDRQTGATTVIVSWVQGTQGSSPTISGDGRFVAVQSGVPNLSLPGNPNPGGDILVRDRQTGTLTRVDVSSSGELGNGNSKHASISADGRFVAFWSGSTNLTSEGFGGGVYVHDRQTGVTTLVSVSSAGEPASGTSPAISGDGRFVAFMSTDSDLDLVREDNGGNFDVFVHDRQTGTTTLASVSSTGEAGNGFGTSNPSISANGRFVAFESNSDNLVPGDTNGDADVFLHDRQTGATIRVNVSSAGVEGDRGGGNPALSENGRLVAFESASSNFVTTFPRTTVNAVYVHDRGTTVVPPIALPPSCSANIGMGDLVFRNTSTGDVASWVMTGLALTNSGILWCGLSLDWQIVGIGDLDGDGTRDLVWWNTSTGDVVAWLMTASGVASMGVLASGVPLDWQIAGVNDLDGNGKADVVWRNTTTGDVAGWLMNGLSLETPGVIVSAVPTEWVIVGIGDLDGDSKDDIVWRNTSTGDVAGWLMNGLSLETPGMIVSAVPAEWIVAGLGDLNNNGTADLVWRNTTTGDVAGWLMNGLSLETPGVIVSAVPAEWAIVGIRDLDDNGTADLVWRNMTTGDVAGWLMNGLSLETPAVIVSAVPLAWEIQP